MSQFAFLQREWSAVLDAATKGEVAVQPDPRAVDESQGLQLFVRSLAGLERRVAKEEEIQRGMKELEGMLR